MGGLGMKKIIFKIKNAFNNPSNLRDVLLGLFVNGLYGLSQDLSLINTLILVVSFYGIIEANDKIRKDR